VSEQLEHIWSLLTDELSGAVGEATYRIWLEQLEPVQLRGEELVLAAPDHALRWIRERFGRVLSSAARGALGDAATVTVIGAGEADRIRSPAAPQRAATSTLPRPGASAPAGDAAVGGAGHGSSHGALGNPKLTFDQFVIGDSNRLAHAAALIVAEMPAQAYNPLFICGPPGVGKTHLLSSIANLVTAHDPGLRVAMTTGEAFTNAFVGALGREGMEAFKSRFRDVDVLLVDDIQFLERKARTEEEFFHTFNALYDGDRQIVLTSDRPPSDLQALEDRLRERFQAGLVADIAPPDFVTRMAILRKRVQHDGIAIPDERPLELIAERINTNVRALEGALIRVVAYSSLTGRELTAPLAEQVLQGLYPPPARAPGSHTIADIQAAACAHFGITQHELLSSGRSPRVTWPRQLAMFLARQVTGESLPTIGREFGGRDHTTVMHACKRTSARLQSDAGARDTVHKLCERLHIPPPPPA
jgi:chromosomal replication initiator protein